SAGILLYRLVSGYIEFLLVHPGGPFFSKKDLGAWSIPKGEFTDEDPLSAAKREFEEETSICLSTEGNFIELKPQKIKTGKIIYAWALEGDIDCSKIVSNTFNLQWPPKSGRFQDFPEIDRGEWFTFPTAKEKINDAQRFFLEEIVAFLKLSESQLVDNKPQKLNVIVNKNDQLGLF
ncbi:MAG: NUDIX domain-containing protein, partial [Bacteroidetes bacterium]|nr:NUDIX domain-containing protein [Bacteroidota bacterium]